VACLALLDQVAACNRTFAMNPEDMEIISEDDFIDDKANCPAEHPLGPAHVEFFINHIRLRKIIWYLLMVRGIGGLPI
jgi:hypothetical protein